MLYKKTHRQYLREWRLDRKFKAGNRDKVYRVSIKLKPYITEGFIQIGGWRLIYMKGPRSGRLYDKDAFKWLD